MSNFFKISPKRQTNAIETIAKKLKIVPPSVEKDVWVTAVLRALFALPYAENLSFKGGTSLSKCYNLTERFSEDIDIAVNRELLGFSGTLSKTQIKDKLRRAACSFVREKLQFDVTKQLENQGINPDLFSVNVNITPVTIEVSGRSMSEPLRKVALQSLVDKEFPDASFADPDFAVNAVVPERTFWEKVCLLHEEFAKSQELIRTERMSRHLYDLGKLDDAGIPENALVDKKLYESIVEHRRTFIGLKGFDYDTLAPKTLKIVPPDFIISQWQQDYETMRETMIYGNSLSFNELIDKIKQLNERINQIDW